MCFSCFQAKLTVKLHQNYWNGCKIQHNSGKQGKQYVKENVQVFTLTTAQPKINLGIIPLSSPFPDSSWVLPLALVAPSSAVPQGWHVHTHTRKFAISQQNISSEVGIWGDRPVDQEEWTRPKEGNDPTAGRLSICSTRRTKSKKDRVP